MKRYLLFLLLLPAMLRAQEPSASVHDSILRALQRLYTPDLKIEWGPDSLRGNYAVKELHYPLEGGQVVSARYYGARQKGAALIIFQHWGGGNRHSFGEEAARFAAAGYNCLLLDAPWLWPTADTLANPLATYPDNILSSCRAVIAFLDWAEGQESFDAQRVYYIGHSYGATLGGLLLAAEPRIRAAVYMAGLPSLSLSMTEDRLGQWKGARERAPALFDSAVRRLAGMEPEELQHRSDAAVFYQAANNDQYVPRIYTERYIRAVKPVQTGWYDTDHLFGSAAAQQDRFAFIRRQDSLRRYEFARINRLWLGEAKRFGTVDGRPWQRQEWRGRTEIIRKGDTIRLRQRWRFAFPDSAYIETTRTDTAGAPDRHWMRISGTAGRRSTPGGGYQELDADALLEERQLFFLYWAAHFPTRNRGQLHLVASDTSRGPVLEWVLRPFAPVRYHFEDSSGRLRSLSTQVSSSRLFRLEPSDYRSIHGGQRPYAYTLTLNGDPYFKAIIREIIVR